MEKPYVAGVGAANVDIHGRSRAAVVMRDSNPGRLRTSAGGVTRNVLENLARQGVETRMLTAVGDDLYGEMIIRASTAAGIDMSGVLTVAGAASSCYIAVLDDRGDMLLGMSDMSILGRVTEEYLDRHADTLGRAAAIVCDPCLPVPVLDHIFTSAPRPPVFLDPVSTAYARAVKPIVGGVYCCKPNRMELAVLSGRDTDTDRGVMAGAEALLDLGVSQVAVSLGERGCYWADRRGNSFFRALSPIPVMANATGAGDAFMSGLVHGFLDGMSPGDTADYALGCGIVAIKSEDTISRAMTDAAVRRAVAEYAIER